jgi:hypothetical protein
MAKHKNLLFYIVIVVGFGALMYWITQAGADLEVGEFVPHVKSSESVTDTRPIVAWIILS